jgi:hypothetical protein
MFMILRGGGYRGTGDGGFRLASPVGIGHGRQELSRIFHPENREWTPINANLTLDYNDSHASSGSLGG